MWEEATLHIGNALRQVRRRHCIYAYLWKGGGRHCIECTVGKPGRMATLHITCWAIHMATLHTRFWLARGIAWRHCIQKMRQSIVILGLRWHRNGIWLRWIEMTGVTWRHCISPSIKKNWKASNEETNTKRRLRCTLSTWFPLALVAASMQQIEGDIAYPYWTASCRWRHCIFGSERQGQMATLHIWFYLWMVHGDIAYACMLDLVTILEKIHDDCCVSFLTWAYTKFDRSEQNEAQSSFDDFQVGPGGDIAYTWCKAYDAWRHCIYISSCINGFAYKDWWFND